MKNEIYLSFEIFFSKTNKKFKLTVDSFQMRSDRFGHLSLFLLGYLCKLEFKKQICWGPSIFQRSSTWWFSSSSSFHKERFSLRSSIIDLASLNTSSSTSSIFSRASVKACSPSSQACFLSFKTSYLNTEKLRANPSLIGLQALRLSDVFCAYW